MSLKKINLHDGITCLVPETKEDNVSPTFKVPDELDDVKGYYEENGYVIINGCLSKEDCDQFTRVWQNKIKPFKGYLSRQSSDVPQKNIFNKKGWVMNSLQNIQNLSIKKLPELRNLYDLYVADNPVLAKTFNQLLNTKRSRIVQSMYFEGNTKTEAHQDSYYLDDEEIGKMAACWIALEDIEWNSGRFYICPGSHKIDKSNVSKINSLFFEKNYIENTYELIKSKKYEVRAPYLNKGDILIWNSLTIHGSLPDIKPSSSRSSITSHYTTANSKFRTYRYKLTEIEVEKRKFVDVFRSYDYDKLTTILKIFLTLKFPKVISLLKKIYIRFNNFR